MPTQRPWQEDIHVTASESAWCARHLQHTHVSGMPTQENEISSVSVSPPTVRRGGRLVATLACCWVLRIGHNT